MTLIKQFGVAGEAKDIATHWRGDYFYATRLKSSLADASAIKPEQVKLAIVSRWSSPAAARRFAEFYRSAVPKRYSGATSHSGSPAPADTEEWDTSEGTVAVRIQGDLVLALESFDEDAASRITAAVLKVDR